MSRLLNLDPNKEGTVIFRIEGVRKYKIQYIEHFVKIIQYFPCDLYFFIWRVLVDDDKRKFEFPIKGYSDSKFWNQTQNHLAKVGFLEPVEFEQPKHIPYEKPLAERCKILDLGKKAFQEWDQKGIVRELINFPESVQLDKERYNQYFRDNIEVLEFQKLINIIKNRNKKKRKKTPKIQKDVYQVAKESTQKERIRYDLDCGFCQKSHFFLITQDKPIYNLRVTCKEPDLFITLKINFVMKEFVLSLSKPLKDYQYQISETYLRYSYGSESGIIKNIVGNRLFSINDDDLFTRLSHDRTIRRPILSAAPIDEKENGRHTINLEINLQEKEIELKAKSKELIIEQAEKEETEDYKNEPVLYSNINLNCPDIVNLLTEIISGRYQSHEFIRHVNLLTEFKGRELKNLSKKFLFDLSRVAGKHYKSSQYYVLIGTFAEWNAKYGKDFSRTAARFFMNRIIKKDLDKINRAGRNYPINNHIELQEELNGFNNIPSIESLSLYKIFKEELDYFNKDFLNEADFTRIIGITSAAFNDFEEMMECFHKLSSKLIKLIKSRRKKINENKFLKAIDILFETISNKEHSLIFLNNLIFLLKRERLSELAEYITKYFIEGI